MRKHLVRIFTAVSTLAVMATAPCTASAAKYNITDLGNGYAYAINENGQIAGSRTIQGYNNGVHPVMWGNGSFTDLGSLGNGGLALGINSLGQAVGCSYTAHGVRAALFSNGTVTDLGNWTARGINDSGQIAGTLSYDRVVLWDGGTLTQISYSEATVDQVAINNAGQVTSRIDGVASIWSNGTGTQLPLLSGTYGSAATSINEAGHVAGWSAMRTSNGVHASFWKDGVGTDLGTMGGYASFAYGINDLDQVVGLVNFTNATSDGQMAAFIYENGAMSDLNSHLINGDGWLLVDAHDINNKGQIVGYGIHNGVRHAYVLNPVPVPPAFWMLGSGLAGLGFLRRRFFSV